MNFLEKDLEQIIYETPPEILNERGLWCNRHYMLRQVNLGAYGIADLVSVTILGKSPMDDVKTLLVRVYELKQKEISLSTLMQAIKYCKGLDEFIQNNFNVNKTRIEFRITLVGSTINLENDFIYLSDFYHNLNIYTYSYDFDGIKFKEHNGYRLTNPSFPKSLKRVCMDSYKNAAKLRDEKLRKFSERDNLPF